MHFGPDAKLRVVAAHLDTMFSDATAHTSASWRHLGDEVAKGGERIACSDKSFQRGFPRDGQFQWFRPTEIETSNESARKSFRTVSMQPKYVGEHLSGNAVFPGRKVKYVTDVEQRKKFQLQIIDGKLCDAKGNLFDTGGREAIFVMDKWGRIFASKMSMSGKFHHSSLMAGGPVAGAGAMRVIQGKLQRLTDESGHYRPPRYFTRQVIEYLRDQGIEMDRVSVFLAAEK
ncbi:hypothetical protein ACLMAJ_19530 [Nocardia sp. KC 131]|uniref:hypothetical protein n=1 Tax=Nocardia arseniciresistens TaxID=3392119 RepID=UPI00398EE9CB